MCQSIKLDFEIIFIKFSHLENILKSGFPPWFYKIIFFKKWFFLISYFSVKSNKYQSITETHKKLSIWIPTTYLNPTVFFVHL